MSNTFCWLYCRSPRQDELYIWLIPEHDPKSGFPLTTRVENRFLVVCISPSDPLPNSFRLQLKKKTEKGNNGYTDNIQPKMKILLNVLLVIGLASYVQGLECLYCSVAQTSYNGYPTEICLHPVTTGATTTSTETCPAAATGTVEYCRSKFVIRDGVVTEADRGCAVSGSDHDENSAAVPGGDRCTTVLDSAGNPTSATTCYFSCSTDSCNSVSATNVQKCTSDCNSGSVQGTCNYITGTCVCTNGWTGTDCNNTIPAPTASRECVQCNSETDSTCTSSTTSIACAGTEARCSTATTTIYDSSEAVVKTVTVRGCLADAWTSSVGVVDECFFSNIFTDAPISEVGYNEVTCMSTCDSDGCNTNEANGVVDGTETKRLYCVQCSDIYGCATEMTRSLCASGATYCKSTVTYLMSEKTDLLYTDDSPAFKLQGVVRECANTPVTAECTETSFSTVAGVKKYTCTETCQEDGCNTGWPARPKCIHCTTIGTIVDNYDACLENPPQAIDCVFPYQAHCVIVDEGIVKNTINVRGIPRRITRGCSHIDIGDKCATTTIRNINIQSCNYTCNTDGCNIGSASMGNTQALLAVIAFNP